MRFHSVEIKELGIVTDAQTGVDLYLGATSCAKWLYKYGENIDVVFRILPDNIVLAGFMTSEIEASKDTLVFRFKPTVFDKIVIATFKQ